MQNKTFAIIKPDAIENRFMGKIIDLIITNNFNILEARLIKMTEIQSKEFYAVHQDKSFFNNLILYMCSGKCLVLSLEKLNAVEEWRNLIGSTDPEEAEKGTIRKLFAESKERNAVHGSDSDKNALIEIKFFFKNE